VKNGRGFSWRRWSGAGRIKARLACAACAERSRSKRSRSIAPYPPIIGIMGGVLVDWVVGLADTLRLIRPTIIME